MEERLPLINYNSRLKITWDIIIIIAVFYSSLIIPFHMVFGHKYFNLLYWIITAAFSIDIIINFNSSVRIGIKVLTNRKDIGRLYLKTWFIPDILSAIPFAPLYLLLFGNAVSGTIIFKILLLMRLLRLLRLFSTKGTLNDLQESLSINPSIMRLIIFAFGFAVSIHFMALGWILIDAGDQTGSFDIRYIRALYWAMTTIATIGYGDITPDRNSRLQMLYTIAVQVIGVGMFGYIIGNISTLLANIDVAKATFFRKLDEIKNYMRLKKIPQELREKVRNYYYYIWETQKSIEGVSFTNELPHTLSTELSLFLNRKILEKVSLFKDADEIFIREVVRLMEPIVFLPNDFIIHEGEFGDCMYFISSGEVEVIINGKSVAKLGGGSFFGETALMQDEKRNASIRAVSYCETYKLSKQSFGNLRNKYTEFNEKINKIMLERLKADKK